jgi:SAM-dependent methyltransferase
VIPDQKIVWDKKHAEKMYEDLRDNPSSLALLDEPKFPRKSKVLDLGCGVGRDAAYFDKKWHKVVATDASAAAILQDKEYFKDFSGEFAVLDMRKPLPYPAESFDVVHVNLALHYYSDKKTKEIVLEIARVLKPGGIFAFACKSYDDIHNNGKELKNNIFVSPTGVVIHLFTKNYAKEITQGLFVITQLDEVEEEYKGRHSKVIRCISRKLNVGEL